MYFSTVPVKSAPVPRDQRRALLPGLTGNNTVVYIDSDGSECVKLHDTVVARRHPGGQIFLDSGGRRTVTTKRRMNEALRAWGSDASVGQAAFRWYVTDFRGDHESREFYDGIVV